MSIGEILSFAFVQRALLAGVLIAAVAAILGVFLVLRRLSLIGDGLAHITFGSVAVVLLIGISPFYVTLAALPLVMVAVPRSAVPSRNCTVPLADAGDTSAVNVTICP